MIDYTLVVGVDAHHLHQLEWTWPTWRKNKPSLLKQPMVAFFDRDQLTADQVGMVIDHPCLKIGPWPPVGVRYPGGNDKWTNAQRYRMLAGFVHVPARHVVTDYWLKLDTDVVATGNDDWIDDGWFKGDPAIVAQSWSFTKPADQMLKLDEWANGSQWFPNRPPLNLVPREGSERLGHKRIISWCGFFHTRDTKRASTMAVDTCGEGMLPVPSQDGFLWYVVTRLGLAVKRVDMKCRGFEHWSAMFNIKAASMRALLC